MADLFRRPLIWLVILPVIALLAPPAGDAQGDPPPDVIFHHGTVLTLAGAPDQWVAEALAVAGERIQAVGDEAAILALAGPETRLIDLGGRTVMPGFVDPHTHLFNDAVDHLGLTLQQAQDLALANGITALGNAFTPPDFLAQMQTFSESDELRVRTSLFLIATDNCGAWQGDWWQEHPPTREPGERLRINGIKIFADGGSCGVPATSFTGFRGDQGDLWLDDAALIAAIETAQAGGYQVAIHALGDRAVEQTLNAIEAALDGGPNIYRHRIEHNAVIRDDLLARYGEVQPVALIFGAFPYCVYEGPPAGYGHWEWRWRDLIAANPDLHIAWHSDTPYVGTANPLDHLYSMVTPYEIAPDGTECPTGDWLTTKQLTVEQALPMMTSEAAYALFREEEIGSLTAGKFADLIILSNNPLAVDPLAIKDIEVLVTLIGGQVEFCADGAEALCSDRSAPVIAVPEPDPTAPPAPPGDNLALGRPVTVLSALPDFTPEMAVDGNLDNWWGSGEFVPGWIEIDLGAVHTIGHIRLLPSQDPPGQTIHRVYGAGPDGDFRMLHIFDRYTRDMQWIEFSPPVPWEGIRTLRIETKESPSWVAWREIEVYE